MTWKEAWEKFKRTNSYEYIAEVITEANISGFGGACGPAAIAINEVFFEGKAKMIGAFNKHMDEAESRFVGHVAVYDEHNECYWDADGEPKEWEEIESWGMLDPHDPDYNFPDEDDAYEVSSKEFTKDDIVRIFRDNGREQIEQLKKAIKDVW